SSAPVAKVPHEQFQPIHCIRDVLHSLKSRIYRQLPGVVEGLSRKLLLAFKMPVDTAFFQPRRPHKVGHGGTVIASLIKDGRRLTNDFLPSLLAFAHISLPAISALRPTGR